MPNENVEEIVLDEVIEEAAAETVEEEVAEREEVVFERPTESLEAKRARLLRQLDQTNKKLGLEPEKKGKSGDLDFGEKAYLATQGIKGVDEMNLVRKLQKETGKDIDSLLETTYFQTELKEFREGRATDNANPKGAKRSNNSSVDTVDYWVAKGELPPAFETQLRRDVVNARMKTDITKGQFYNS